MRKLVLAVIAILAIFTFIREYSPRNAGKETQRAQIMATQPD